MFSKSSVEKARWKKRINFKLQDSLIYLYLILITLLFLTSIQGTYHIILLLKSNQKS